MILFIEVKDGQSINHPALESNLIEAFGLVPANWEPFSRIERPQLDVYEVFESDPPSYKKVDGVWTDAWVVRSMTNDEKAAKQQIVKDAWAARYQAENWASWLFNETTCQYDPPTPRPEPVEGVIVFWCGAENNWKVAPEYPQDGKEYRFDFLGWQWEAIPNV